jgi:hypothetical protein
MPSKNDKDTIVSELNEDLILITSSEKINQEKFEKAMYDLESKEHTYSAYLNDCSIGNSNLSDSELDDLADNPQTNIFKVIKINGYIRKEVNKNGLIGKVYECIESNLNTNVELLFKNYSNNRNKNKIREKAEQIIKDFNEKINLEDLISKSVPMTYLEGNYFMCLRSENEDYKIDYYPLGVCELSDYEISGEPYILINVRELASRLRKINKKNKDGTYLFFKDIDEEIKKNYPPEVFTAYKKKEQYAKLDITNTGVIRVNNLNRKYGVSSIFKCLKDSLILESFKLSDQNNTKTKGKIIIFQKTDTKILGEDGKSKPYTEVQYSHLELAKAVSRDGVCLYTGMPWVSSVEYLETKNTQDTNPKMISYRNEIATALGISFITSTDKSGVAEISIGQLMKTINRITSQLEKILKKWYKFILDKNGIPSEYVPSIKIVDSELMSMELKLQLCDALFNKYGASYKTIYGILDRDFAQEEEFRKNENEEQTDIVFKPRLTGYTANSDAINGDNNGRPPDSKDKDRQSYDKEYNKDNLRTS